jgi:hypothetical protein
MGREGDFFLARLRERWSTLRRITEYLLEQQRGLMAGDISYTLIGKVSVAMREWLWPHFS